MPNIGQVTPTLKRRRTTPEKSLGKPKPSKSKADAPLTMKNTGRRARVTTRTWETTHKARDCTLRLTGPRQVYNILVNMKAAFIINNNKRNSRNRPPTTTRTLQLNTTGGRVPTTVKWRALLSKTRARTGLTNSRSNRHTVRGTLSPGRPVRSIKVASNGSETPPQNISEALVAILDKTIANGSRNSARSTSINPKKHLPNKEIGSPLNPKRQLATMAKSTLEPQEKIMKLKLNWKKVSAVSLIDQK